MPSSGARYALLSDWLLLVTGADPDTLCSGRDSSRLQAAAVDAAPPLEVLRPGPCVLRNAPTRPHLDA